jgi:urease accessory protein
MGDIANDIFVGRECEYIDVGWGDARKHRQLVRTTAGRELAIDLPRGTLLAAGSVLWDDGRTVVVVRRPPEDAIVLEFAQNSGIDTFRRALLLGYLLGNQHAPLQLTPTELRTPLMTAPDVARQVLADLEVRGSVTRVPLAEHGWTTTSADHHEVADHGQSGPTAAGAERG